MRAVNLLPRDAEGQRSEGGRAPLFVAAGGIAAVTAVMVVLFLSASGSIDDQRAQLDSVEAAIARVDDAGQSTVAPGAVAQERTDRVAALSAALTTRVPLDRLLRELAFVLPEDAWLTGLSAAAPSATAAAGAPAATATSQGVTIQGATYSLASVARVLSRLAAIPSLSGVRLIASARVDPAAEQAAGTTTKPKSGKTVVTFSVAANIGTGSGT